MVYINPLGRNWHMNWNWDFLGIFYISIAVTWTIILYSGIAWLYFHRHLPFLKIRNVPLAIAATSFLHVYLVKILSAYTINGHFECSAEFWIMSIYLPFGIALFQANMVQLLSISVQQKRFLERSSIGSDDFWPKHYEFNIKGILRRWRDMTPVRRTQFLIGFGMLCQLAFTLLAISCKVIGARYLDQKDRLPAVKVLNGIIVMQAVTVFIPIFEAYRLHRQGKDMRFLTFHQEPKGSTSTSIYTSSARGTSLGSHHTINYTSTPNETQIMAQSLQALDETLAMSPTSLLHFAATKDFTGENIVFLLAVHDWKARWEVGPITTRSRSVLFKQAVEIYAQSVSETTSRFPIYTEGHIREELDKLFETAMKLMAEDRKSEERPARAEGTENVGNLPAKDISRRIPSWRILSIASRRLDCNSKSSQVNIHVSEVANEPDIPTDFGIEVFDKAEEVIKRLVVTNTWWKYMWHMEEEVWRKNLSSGFAI